eukprot:gene26308-32872_t
MALTGVGKTFNNPGRVRHEINVGLPRPRHADSPAVRALAEHVYRLMTMG